MQSLHLGYRLRLPTVSGSSCAETANNSRVREHRQLHRARKHCTPPTISLRPRKPLAVTASETPPEVSTPDYRQPSCLTPPVVPTLEALPAITTLEMPVISAAKASPTVSAFETLLIVPAHSPFL
ncbi:hypothetical protein EVAR_74813_1 [Eumeta japonica]|uniref:Uncharacterized protein n=1 Tax=Eumeta variegata TaxID=151549 RepID=A0A4C1SQ65_EUMVA|nr:hypothetical protein EVAR_74813_1 [Eumeta japonica]